MNHDTEPDLTLGFVLLAFSLLVVLLWSWLKGGPT